MGARRFAGVVTVVAGLGVGVALAPSAAAESTPSAYGSRLVTLINQARAQHGLAALTVTSGTSTVASAWAQHLDREQALSHNPDLAAQLESHGSPDWTAYSENVAEDTASSADQMFQAYMSSAEHRGNILDAHYRYIGVGVVFDGSTAWNTLDFVDQYSSSTKTSSTSSSSTTSTRSSTTSTAPKTTATTTTPTKTTATRATTTATSTTGTRRPASTVTSTRTVAHPATVRPAAKPRRVAVHGTSRPHAPRAATSTALTAPAAPIAHVPASPVAARLSVPARSSDRDPTMLLALAAALTVVVGSRYVIAVSRRRA